MDEKQRLLELRQLISKYSYEYYTLDKPSIPDSVYDMLFRQLSKQHIIYTIRNTWFI